MRERPTRWATAKLDYADDELEHFAEVGGRLGKKMMRRYHDKAALTILLSAVTEVCGYLRHDGMWSTDQIEAALHSEIDMVITSMRDEDEHRDED